MNKTRIFSVILFVVALGLSYYLYRIIMQPIERQEEIAKVEVKVVEKLKMIREAQKEYFAANKVYANKWDELVAFVDTGISYEVQRTEIVTLRDITLRHLGDSVRVEYDTLSSIPVREKLFPEKDYPNFDVKNLPFVPNKDFKFELFAGETTMGGVLIQVLEVMDPKPEDGTRKKDHEFKNKRNLYFGSRDKASLDGNWSERE